MGRRRKKAGRKKSQSFGLVSFMVNWLTSEWVQSCKRPAGLAAIFLIVVVGIVVVFGQMEGYVANIVQQRQVALTVELKDPPQWISEQLISEICLMTT